MDNMDNNENKPKRYIDMRLVIGLIIVLVGGAMLVDNLWLEMDFDIWDFWPVLLIIAGLGMLIQPKFHRKELAGFIFVAVGILFLLDNLGYISFGFEDLWPILIIIVGVEIIRGGCRTHRLKGHHRCCGEDWDKDRHKNGTGNVSNGFVNVSAVLGSGNHIIADKELKGGVISATLGESVVDFRNAEMKGDRMEVTASAIMAGVELRVPPHWEVVLEGTPIMGSMENKARIPDQPTKKLIVKGSAIMGAVEIKD
jgi:predicted membrane protein